MKSIYTLFLLLIISCQIDEEAPPRIKSAKAWYTIKNSTHGVELSWTEPDANDINSYLITRYDENNNKKTFESSDNYFFDQNVKWEVVYNYLIQAEDVSGNLNDFSDTLSAYTYSAGGIWESTEYDSTYLSIYHDKVLFNNIVNIGYSIEDNYKFELINNESSTDTIIGDTILSLYQFSSANIDSIKWEASGWMTLQNTFYDTNEVGDTIIITKNSIPVYYNMSLSDKNNGSISFYSNKYNTIYLKHSFRYCNGEEIEF